MYAGATTETTEPQIVGYRLHRRLAVGGMAEVFLAHPTAPDALGAQGGPVVVKRLLPGADETLVRWLDRERHVLSCVASPNVVRLLDAGRDYLVLEYVDGPDLATLLQHLARRGRKLPLGAAVVVLDAILAGLADIHEAVGKTGRRLGAVHRDLNPSNVLVSRDGEVKVADLGVVHVEALGQPTQEGLKGTLAYMAPEQLLGRPVDARTDLYAAALVAYEALTGLPARPARMAGVAELLDARTRLPTPPSAVRPDLPAALDAWVLAALDPAPDRRPPDARTWRQGLREAAGVDADRDALAELARAVVPTVARVAGTLAPHAPEERKQRRPARTRDRRSSPRNRRWVWTMALPALVGVVLAADAMVKVPDRAEGDRTGSLDAAGVAPAPGLPGDSRSHAPDPIRDAPSRAEASAPGVAEAPVRTPGSGVAPIRHPTTGRVPSSPTIGATGVLREAALHVEVRPAGSPVHVDGAGARGLAPRDTGPLPEGATLLTLHGDAAGLPPALVRLVRAGDRITATIGTLPGRHFDRIQCGERDVGETSAVGIRIQDETRCQVSADGATLGFALAVVRP